MNPSQNKTWNNIAVLIFHLAMAITIAAVFVPFTPDMPAASLDPSWKIGLNQAVAQGLRFGRDMIFTFGPYSFVFSEAYHPATDTLMLVGCCYLAVVYFVCLNILIERRHYLWMAGYGLGLTCMLYPRDALLFSVPLLIAMAIYQRYLSEDRPVSQGARQTLYVALLISPLGLLPLAKGSLFILSAGVAFLCSAYFGWKKQYQYAAVCVIAPICSAFFFWVLIGQPVTGLFDYVHNMQMIISGYTEAMALYGDNFEIKIYLISSLIVLIYLLTLKNLANQKKIYFVSLYALFFFVSFKAGFTRHDLHSLTSANALLIAGLLLPVIVQGRLIILIMVLCCGGFYGVARGNSDDFKAALIGKFEDTYRDAAFGLLHRLSKPDWPRSEYDATLTQLSRLADFPKLNGTTDIYSFDQSYLIASNLQWSPRPILQSYSAYTPELAEINRQHVLGANAPDNIIFRVQPIDFRLPTLMDGPSWPALLRNYRAAGFHNDYLVLEKRAAVNTSENLIALTSSTQHLGQPVPIPQSASPVFAQIELVPTLLGRLMNIAFKPRLLVISMENFHGMTMQYRFVATMARSQFLISPMVENTYEFKLLGEDPALLEKKRVKSIAIFDPGQGSPLWQDEYKIHFSEFTDKY
jgi:hypothetical protein